MRLWSLNPKYLDNKGLVACWREALLAQRVMLGPAKGYIHHPQLERFRSSMDPVGCIGAYLETLADEAERRGLSFDRKRIIFSGKSCKIPVTQGQLHFETEHLKNKLEKRASHGKRELKEEVNSDPNKIFELVPGDIEKWEK